jgi:hypothetical protein
VQADPTKAALVRRRFARRPESAAAVRRFIRGGLARSGLARGADAWETAQLLASETVTSALDQAARVEVSDDGGPARLRRRARAVRPAGGRGLELVQALAAGWGVRESSTGRTIWFEVDIADR